VYCCQTEGDFDIWCKISQEESILLATCEAQGHRLIEHTNTPWTSVLMRSSPPRNNSYIVSSIWRYLFIAETHIWRISSNMLQRYFKCKVRLVLFALSPPTAHWQKQLQCPNGISLSCMIYYQIQYPLFLCYNYVYAVDRFRSEFR